MLRFYLLRNNFYSYQKLSWSNLQESVSRHNSQVNFDASVENNGCFGFLYAVHNDVAIDSRSSAQWFHMCIWSHYWTFPHLTDYYLFPFSSLFMKYQNTNKDTRLIIYLEINCTYITLTCCGPAGLNTVKGM